MKHSLGYLFWIAKLINYVINFLSKLVESIHMLTWMMSDKQILNFNIIQYYKCLPVCLLLLISCLYNPFKQRRSWSFPHSVLTFKIRRFTFYAMYLFNQLGTDFYTWIKTKSRISLVVQLLTICLPMQGTEVQSLIQEDSTCTRTT